MDKFEHRIFDKARADMIKEATDQLREKSAQQAAPRHGLTGLLTLAALAGGVYGFSKLLPDQWQKVKDFVQQNILDKIQNRDGQTQSEGQQDAARTGTPGRRYLPIMRQRLGLLGTNIHGPRDERWVREVMARRAAKGGGPGKAIPGGTKPSKDYEIRGGDTLWSLADRVYGSGSLYPRLMQLNPNITDPNVITPGANIRLPIRRG